MTAIIWGRKSFQGDSSPADENLPDSIMKMFTPMQQEVLKMVIDGRTNREIAAELGIDRKEVKNAVQSLLSELIAATKGRHTIE
jgi:DNA-binding NarL/FixJ family response regulator